MKREVENKSVEKISKRIYIYIHPQKVNAYPFSRVPLSLKYYVISDYNRKFIHKKLFGIPRSDRYLRRAQECDDDKSK